MFDKIPCVVKKVGWAYRSSLTVKFFDESGEKEISPEMKISVQGEIIEHEIHELSGWMFIVYHPR